MGAQLDLELEATRRAMADRAIARAIEADRAGRAAEAEAWAARADRLDGLRAVDLAETWPGATGLVRR